jgi:hypothetical protein
MAGVYAEPPCCAKRNYTPTQRLAHNFAFV